MKIFFAGTLVALVTLTTVSAPAQMMGAAQSKKPAVVALPQDAGEAAQALDPSLPGTRSAERAALSRLQKRTVNSYETTPSSSLSFLPGVAYDSGGRSAFSVAVADVNGDGQLDVVVANYGSSSVGVLLGNGDGTFRAAVTYGSGGVNPVSVVIADVNGDGKPDLLVANSSSQIVGVLLGNGDGTFQTVVTYDPGGNRPTSVAVADVNGDGKPDLLVANNCDSHSNTSGGNVGVLLGNGDGTFQPAVTYLPGTDAPYAIAVADVNGDGKLDLVVGSQCADGSCANGAVGVLFGNGDGTFQPVAVSYDSGGSSLTAVAIADVNGDHKPDLVVANCAPKEVSGCGGSGNGVVGILLGNGDGTFKPVVTYDPGGGNVFSLAVSDVNGDGKPDLLVPIDCGNIDCNEGAVSVLLGKGNGTFQSAVLYGSGGLDAYSVSVADVN